MLIISWLLQLLFKVEMCSLWAPEVCNYTSQCLTHPGQSGGRLGKGSGSGSGWGEEGDLRIRWPVSSEAEASFWLLNFGWLFYLENPKAAICAWEWCSQERDRSRPLSSECTTGSQVWKTGRYQVRQASEAFDSNGLANFNWTKTSGALSPKPLGKGNFGSPCFFRTGCKHRGLVVYCSVPYMYIWILAYAHMHICTNTLDERKDRGWDDLLSL